MTVAKYRHVVILGGGFTGPLIATVISHFAEKITLVERYSRDPDEKWMGTPQSEHGHYLTYKGQILLEKLLPGILQELKSLGAIEVDWAKDTSWTGHGGITPLYTSGVKTLLFSRKLLDRVIFAKASQLNNLAIVKDTVNELEICKSQIQAVHLNDSKIISDADLVIDARGRMTKMREKLQNVVGPIPEKYIHNNITYHTISLNTPQNDNTELKQFYRQPDITNEGIGYFASTVEGHRTLFTLSDYYGQVNSRPFETLKFHPLLKGKQLPKPHTFKNLSSVHTQYGKSQTWIKNYLLIGDAICRLNPVFAHGLTMALEMATVFREELIKDKKISTHYLQRRFDKLVRIPWLFVQIDSIRSHRDPAPIRIRLGRALIRAMFFTTAYDPKVHRTALRVVHLINSPLALLAPHFCFRVLVNLIFRRRRNFGHWRMKIYKPISYFLGII